MAGGPPDKRPRQDGGPDGMGGMAGDVDAAPVTGVLERRTVEEKMRLVCAKLVPADPAPAPAPAAAVSHLMPAIRARRLAAADSESRDGGRE